MVGATGQQRVTLATVAYAEVPAMKAKGKLFPRFMHHVERLDLLISGKERECRAMLAAAALGDAPPEIVQDFYLEFGTVEQAWKAVDTVERTLRNLDRYKPASLRAFANDCRRQSVYMGAQS